MGERIAVINLHGRRGHPDYDPELNPQVVYLGRRQWWGRDRILPAHPLANYYGVNRYGRDVALAMYRRDLVKRPDLQEQLGTLRGYILACWCAPSPCHCDVVAELMGGAA